MLSTEQVVALSEGRNAAGQALADWVVLLYAELRKLAGRYLRRERDNHTLQTTALVHEAFLRLLEQREVQWESRTQVIGLAAQLMRRILLDYSRAYQAGKRGGQSQRIYLEAEASLGSKDRTAEILVLDQALTRLSQVDPQQAQIVELRFFGGLSIEETAELLGISPATVKRDWSVAKAWLARELRHV
jgi:RNA polymerase sigma factor (TIGR02999 family)